MRKLLLALAFSVLSFFPASANWTGKDATPATITFYNPAVCTSVVCVPVFQLTDGTNQVTLTTAGADGVSNTLTGQPVYGRMFNFNGTTWDRWTGAVKLNATPTLANGNGVVPTQGGAVLSATNGLYANILQGNAVNSLTNPFFMSPATGAAWSITAASLPLAPLAATSTKQSDGTQKSQQVDGSGNVAPAGDTAARAGFQKLTDGTNTMAVKAASTAAGATDPSGVTNESPNSQLSVDMHTTAVNSAAALPAQLNHTTNIGAVDSISQYPAGATPLTASATGTTAATTATLAGTTGKTTYVCGYSIRANATGNTNVTNTLTGVISGTMSSIMWVPANTAGLGVDEQIFSPCIPASATNTGISAVSGAPGTGGLVSSKIWGYQL